jgi:hypothetical protein
MLTCFTSSAADKAHRTSLENESALQCSSDELVENEIDFLVIHVLWMIGFVLYVCTCFDLILFSILPDIVDDGVKCVSAVYGDPGLW